MELFVYGRDKRNLKGQRKTTALGQADLVPRGLPPCRRALPISCCQHRDKLQDLQESNADAPGPPISPGPSGQSAGVHSLLCTLSCVFQTPLLDHNATLCAMVTAHVRK